MFGSKLVLLLVLLSLLGCFTQAKIRFAGIITQANDESLFRQACRARVGHSKGLTTEMCNGDINAISNSVIQDVRENGLAALEAEKNKQDRAVPLEKTGELIFIHFVVLAIAIIFSVIIFKSLGI